MPPSKNKIDQLLNWAVIISAFATIPVIILLESGITNWVIQTADWTI